MWSVPYNLNLHDTYLGIAMVYNRKQFFVKLNPDNTSKYGLWNLNIKLNFFITSLNIAIVYNRNQFFFKLNPDSISKYGLWNLYTKLHFVVTSLDMATTEINSLSNSTLTIFQNLGCGTCTQN